MTTLALTATDAAIWAGLVTAVLASLTAAIVAVIGALRGTAANAKSDANAQRIDAVSNTNRSLQTAVRDIARDMPPPARLPGLVNPPAATTYVPPDAPKGQ